MSDDKHAPRAAGLNNGLGYNGEFKMGKITLGMEGDGRISIRREGVAEKTLVAEAEMEGIFQDHFFTHEYGDTAADAARRTDDLAAEPHGSKTR